MNPLAKIRKFRSNTRGDTIVEVLISIAILAAVLGTAVVTSAHSLQTGTDAGNRHQGLALAQQQIELIKNAANSTPSQLSNFTINKPFCVKPDGTVDTADIDPATKLCPLPGIFGE